MNVAAGQWELLAWAMERSTSHQDQGHIGHRRLVCKVEILRNYIDRGLDMSLAHLQQARSELNPGHSDRQNDDGVDKNQRKQGDT